MASKNTYKKRITPGVYFEDKNINDLGKGVNNDKYNETRKLIENGYLADEFFGDLLLSEDNKILERESIIENFEVAPIPTTTTTTTVHIISDVDLLKQLRDANPQSTGLTALFSDLTDPYTEWWLGWDNGALFGSSPQLITWHQQGYLIGYPPSTPLIPDKCYILMVQDYYGPLNNYIEITSLLSNLTSVEV